MFVPKGLVVAAVLVVWPVISTSTIVAAPVARTGISVGATGSYGNHLIRVKDKDEKGDKDSDDRSKHKGKGKDKDKDKRKKDRDY